MQVGYSDQSRERVMAVNGIRKINDERKKEITRLEEIKNRLQEEIRQKRSRFQETSNNEVLTPSKGLGYTLSGFSISNVNGDERTYNAFCAELPYLFRLSVTMKGDEITLVDLAIARNSVLLEIESTLTIISEERCPHLLLMTIQQFIHLSTFRMSVINKITSSAQGAFEVHAPNLHLETDKHFFTIMAYQKKRPRSEGLEIRWYIKWDSAYQALLHLFSVPSIKNSGCEAWRKRLKFLTEPSEPFTNANSQTLMDWWDEFSNDITSV